MKRFFKIVAIILVIAALGIGGFAFYMTRGLNSGKNLTIGHVNASGLENGVYKGNYDGGRWTNETNVTVEDGKIVKIEITKTVKFGNPQVSKELIDEVIDRQDTDVDTISGATVTSKAYLKSIEKALTK